MLKILVKDATVSTQSGTAKRTGKPYSMRSQSAWVEMGKPFPVEVKVTLGDDQLPFALGEYTLSSQCFRVNQYNELTLDLRHMKAAAAPGR